MKTDHYTGLFSSQAAEEKFVRRFGALVDQVGIHNIIVCVPMHWAPDFAAYQGNVRLQFSTATEIKIIVNCGPVVIEETASLFEMNFRRVYRRQGMAA
jgi:hypothetical protein